MSQIHKTIHKLVSYYHITKTVIGDSDFKFVQKIKTVVTDYDFRLNVKLVVGHYGFKKL